MFRQIILTISLLALAVFTAAAQGTGTASTSGPNASTPATATKRGPVFRPTKDQIKQVQQILKDKKLYTAEPSGKYDDDTRAGDLRFRQLAAHSGQPVFPHGVRSRRATAQDTRHAGAARAAGDRSGARRVPAPDE